MRIRQRRQGRGRHRPWPGHLGVNRHRGCHAEPVFQRPIARLHAPVRHRHPPDSSRTNWLPQPTNPRGVAPLQPNYFRIVEKKIDWRFDSNAEIRLTSAQRHFQPVSV